jgi:undecaprenyl-diphosphatase
MTYLDALILGIVEGLTEFLPISSTGHLMIAQELLGIADSNFATTFNIVIQLGAISAVALLYWRRLLIDHETMKRVFAAFVPTAVIGFALYQFIKQFLLKSIPVVLCSLAIGGVIMILFERLHGEKRDGLDKIPRMSYWQAVGVGLLQALAVVPGVSRAAATVLGGMALGIRRATTVEFSFLLAVPTTAAATAYDLYKSAGSMSLEHFELLTVGFATSFLVALIAIGWLLRFVKTHTFEAFGVYRILAAGVFFLLLYVVAIG